MSTASKYSFPWLSVMIVVLAGLAVFYPTIQYPGFLQTSTHDGFIATGDHGRDLYAFFQTMQGKRPYVDYWWDYGPLMPYYYGIMMKIFKADMHAVHIGKLLLNISSGLLFFFIGLRIMGKAASTVATLWFLLFNPGFYHTYNNAGGITLILGILLLTVHYIEDRRRSHFYWAQLLLALLMLVKLNIGACMLLAFYGSIILLGLYIKKIDLKKSFVSYILTLAGVVIVVGLIYAWFLFGLPWETIAQYLPFFNALHIRAQPVSENIYAFVLLYWGYFTSGKITFLLLLLILICTLQTVMDFYRSHREKNGTGRSALLILVILIIFYLALMHEYLMTGIFYRTFWGVPLAIMLMYVVIYFGTQRSNKILRSLLYGTLLAIVIFQVADRYAHLRLMKTPAHFFDHKKARIYVDNDREWIDTIGQTTRFLEKNLGPGEMFLALPYEPIYYFLMERSSPTPQLSFYEIAKPTREGELEIIDKLEERKVNWIIMSNAVHSEEESFGIFGVTHCRDLSNHIGAHYKPVAEFGDFSQKGGWASHYAVRILQRQPR